MGIQYADPWSVWTWGLQPVLRRIQWVYGASVRFEYRMGGLFENLADWRKSNHLEGPKLAEWVREAARRTGAPVDPEFLSKAGVTSSYPACFAVTAAQAQAPEPAARLLRRIMENVQVRSLPCEDELIRRMAVESGLDGRRLLHDMKRAPAIEAFEKVRGRMLRSGGRFTDIEWRAGKRDATVVSEAFDAAPHEAAIDRLAPGLKKQTPADLGSYFQGNPDLVPTREIEVVFGVIRREAEQRLGTLWQEGRVERWSIVGEAFWTARRLAARSGSTGP